MPSVMARGTAITADHCLARAPTPELPASRSVLRAEWRAHV